MRDYRRKNRFIDYNDIITSPIAPGVSILAPAYNEDKSIVQNVKSLLSPHYGRTEVMIINDGSKDETLDRLIEAFDLKKTRFAFRPAITTKSVRGIYKSMNRSYSKLIVIDKENGGKADALNAGINISSLEILACIDVDCILSQDAIARMVRPFMEETNRKVIVVGVVIEIANNSKGKPENIFGRIPKVLPVGKILLSHTKLCCSSESKKGVKLPKYAPGPE